ncbi:MAG: CusA/CzcA family heavy metal efflux RND transporter [Polyangiaceae bacterium]
MIERFVDACLEHRLAVMIATLVVAIFGSYSFQHLTIEAFPDPTDTQVQIITLNPGQPAEEMERQVSIPIERAVNGMPGLVRTRSINLFGLSYVTLTFRDGTDAYFARQQTTERLRVADLPDGVKPELGSYSTPIGEVYRYSLTSDPPNPLELRTLQDWVVRPKMLQVDGVADVVSFGGMSKEIHVRPDPVAMAARAITLRDLEDGIRRASSNASGGTLERGTEQLVIRSEGLFADTEDVGRVAIATRGGTPVLLSDVASIHVGWTPRQGVASRGLEADTVEGIILMRRGENPSDVLERVRAKVNDLNSVALKVRGAKIDVFYDRTEMVASTMHTVEHNLIEGAVLVLAVLMVFLLDIRAALIVAVLIPLSLMCAFGYLYSRGMSANLLSMGAVDFGVIVDGAVVIIEAIAMRIAPRHHHGHGGHDDHSAAEAHAGHAPEPESIVGIDMVGRIRLAVHEVARPTVFSLLIILAAYLPIFLLQRVEGRIFAPMAHTVVAALLGGLLFSISLVPVLAVIVYRKPQPHRESPVLRWALLAYQPTLRAARRWPGLVLGAASALLVASGWILTHRGSEFLPELNEGAIYITFTLPGNTSLNEARRMMPVLNEIIDQFPQVESRFAQLGRPEDGTDPKLANNLEVFVKLKPATDWPAATPTLGSVMDSMNAKLAAIPGLEINFSQPIRDNVNESIAGQQGQVALKIYHDDILQLQKAADEAKDALAKVQGVADLGIVKAGEVPQLQIKPRREVLGRFGLSMDDVQAYISTSLGGRAVGSLWEQERVFDVVLRLPDASRDSIEQLESLRVPTPSGGLVPLSTLCDIRVGYGRAAINRENGQRYVGVRMNVRGRDLGSFVDDARVAVDKAVVKAPGMTLEWGGEFESKERAMQRLKLVVPVTLVITLALLFQAFGSMRLALLVLLHVPFALIGGALGLWAFDMPVSIAAAVGFIALVGQASLNGVLVVSAIAELRKMGVGLEEAIERGACDRLRPVLMTAALAALGLIPAAFSKAMGAEMQRPIAVVIVGGTVSAAMLTLVVMPVSFLVATRIGEKLMRRENGGATESPAE